MNDDAYQGLPTQQLTVRSRLLKIPGLKLIAKVGDGGMAEVWKAWDIPNQRLVAVKILDRKLAGDDGEVGQFRTEAQMMEEIHHPGIVQAYSFGNGNGNWYFIMEFVDGYNFSDLLRRKQHVSEADCLLICESVAVALDYAWNEHGIVHCDIKPENVMINADGVVKVTDLGISHQFCFREGLQTASDHVLGTPAYISPEQVYGDVEPDCRADIYSLGATLYHLATGRVLFPGLDADAMMRAQCDDASQAKDPRTYRPELSEGFCQVLEAMLVKNREYRISSWKDVYQMCRDVEGGVRFKPRDAKNAKSSVLLVTK